MGIAVYLIPNGDLAVGASWSQCGGGATYSDALDPFGLAFACASTVAGAADALELALTTVTLDTDQRVSKARMIVTQLNPVFATWPVQGIIAGGGENGPNLTLSPAAGFPMIGAWYNAPSATYSEFTQTAINGLEIHFGAAGAAVPWTLTGAYVELDVVTRPVVSIALPLGVTGPHPFVQWATALVGDSQQTSWEVAIFTTSQVGAGGFDPATTPAVYRATGVGQASSHFVAAPLPAGSYAVYVRAATVLFDGTVNGPASPLQWFSDWDISPFTAQATADAVVPVLGNPPLGCGTWQVYIAERGGNGKALLARWSSLRFRRDLNTMTQLSVVTAECGTLELDPWTHELAVWRDDEEAWVGPYLDESWQNRVATLGARDLFQHFERRPMVSDLSYSGSDLAYVFTGVAIDALSEDTTPGILVLARASGVIGDRDYLADENDRAADVLRELARNGVDFTMVGRTLVVGGAEIPVAALPELWDAHLPGHTAKRSGADLLTRVKVIGKPPRDPGDPTIVSTRGGVDVDRGLVHTTFREQAIIDQTSADIAAQTRLDFRQDAPLFVTGRLDSSAPLSFGQLIPGAHVPVKLYDSGLRVVETMRLQTVDVAVTAGPDGSFTEDVTVTLQTLGTVA